MTALGGFGALTVKCWTGAHTITSVFRTADRTLFTLPYLDLDGGPVERDCPICGTRCTVDPAAVIKAVRIGRASIRARTHGQPGGGESAPRQRGTDR